jgi:4-oxalomesaconate tautomerase
MCLASAPKSGGAIATRNFIPHTVHKAIGVFGAVSVATACVVPGSVTAKIARVADTGRSRRLDVEHPTGFFTVEMNVETQGSSIRVQRAALLRTARKIMAGNAFVAASIWDGK